MYSEKVRSKKIGFQEGRSPQPISYTMKLIDGFCTKEDVFNVPQTELFNLFDDYCKENGYSLISHRSIGRAFSKKFDLGSRTVRNNGKVVRIYVPKDKENGSRIGKIEKTMKLIDGFCKREDVLDVPQKKVLGLFDKYCGENGYPIVPHNVSGRAFSKKFNLGSEVVRYNGEMVRIYVEKR